MSCVSVSRTYEEINEKIRSGKVVVVTADEVAELAAERGVSLFEEYHVVYRTFGAMSSGAF